VEVVHSEMSPLLVEELDLQSSSRDDGKQRKERQIVAFANPQQKKIYNNYKSGVAHDGSGMAYGHAHVEDGYTVAFIENDKEYSANEMKEL